MAQIRAEIDSPVCELIEQIPGKVSGRPHRLSHRVPTSGGWLERGRHRCRMCG